MKPRHRLGRTLSVLASFGLVAGLLVASAPGASGTDGCGAAIATKHSLTPHQASNCIVGPFEQPPAPMITSADNTTFTEGVDGSFHVTTTGSPTPGISETGALPAGVTLTDNGDGTATLHGVPDAGTSGDYPITITASNGILPDATQDFTLSVVLPATIEGTVWNDLNGNGVADTGGGSEAPATPGDSVLPADAVESGEPGVTVCLDQGNDGQCDVGDPSTTTDANGLYRFDYLVAGTYHVQLVVPNGWHNTGAATHYDVTVNPADDNIGNDFFIQQDAQLSLTKTGSPDPVQELNPITYTLQVGNSGSGNANNVVMTDNLPPGTAFDSASTTQGSCSHTATTVTCHLGTVSPPCECSPPTVTIIVQAPNVTDDTFITNNASVSASNAATAYASVDTQVTANTGGSTQGEAPPGATVPLTFTTSTESTAKGAPAVDGTDPTAVSLRVPPGGPGGSILLEELSCTHGPCSGPGSLAPATSSVVLGNVVFNVVPPTGYPANKPFRVTLLYDTSLNPTAGPILYFKDGVSTKEIKLHSCSSSAPRGKAPCLLMSSMLHTTDPLTNGDWKVIVKINSDPRLHHG